jgi:hypothetical protein
MGDTNVAPSGASDGSAVGGASGVGQQGQEQGQGAQMSNPMNKGQDAGVTEEELKKSMDKLENIVSSTVEGRKSALFAKGGKEGLNAEENLELMKLLGGERLGKSLKDETAALLAPSDQLEKSLDVSPFIEHLNENLTKSMLQVAEHIEKSDRRNQEQIVVIAKGLLDLGRVVHEGMQLQKAVAQQLGVAMRQPARAPRAIGAGGQTSPVGALDKSFAGQPHQGEQLSKAEVSSFVSEMLKESLEKGQDGRSAAGFDIAVEASQYEQFNQFSSPAFVAEVTAFAKSKRQQRMNGHAR